MGKKHNFFMYHTKTLRHHRTSKIQHRFNMSACVATVIKPENLWRTHRLPIQKEKLWRSLLCDYCLSKTKVDMSDKKLPKLKKDDKDYDRAKKRLTKCQHCRKDIQEGSLSRHIRTKHPNEDPRNKRKIGQVSKLRQSFYT